MSPERRREIIEASLLILHRHKASLAPAGASAERPAARPASSSWSAAPGRAPSEPEDEVGRWRREGLEIEARREAGREVLRIEEELHRRRQHETDDTFWRSIDARIEAALEAQRSAIFQIVAEGFRATTDIADAVNNRFVELEEKLAQVRTLITKSREHTTRELKQRRAEREITDVPPLKNLMN